MKLAAARRCLIALLLVPTIVAGCGGRSPDAAVGDGHGRDLLNLPTTTRPATGPATKTTWALYRDIHSLDPIAAFDYPEDTVISTLCDALQRQQPDGSVTAGLANGAYRTPTSLVLDVRSNVVFWDGTPLTADDVAYSLERNLDPNLISLYTNVFDRVQRIDVTGARQVTITLKQPDYWLLPELSAMPGVVVSKRYAESRGPNFGTPDGGTMCSGPFELENWTPGRAVQVKRNPQYWDSGLSAMSDEVDFVGVPDAAALTSGLATGEIDGTYLTDPSNLSQLQKTPGISVSLGPSFDGEYLIPMNLGGPLQDVRVRRALSLAFDRKAYIDRAYAGLATSLRLPSNPGTWGPSRDVFAAAWKAATEPPHDVDEARRLVQEAGAQGKTITLGTSTGLATVATGTEAWRAAIESIGLKVDLRNVSPENYINFFTDPAARIGVDAVTTTTFGDYADPTSLTATYLLPGGVQNYSNYQNPAIAKLLDLARGEADPTKRAQTAVEVEKAVMVDLPWIPVVAPPTYLVLNTSKTGAPTSFVYMQAPWLARLGAAG